MSINTMLSLNTFVKFFCLFLLLSTQPVFANQDKDTLMGSEADILLQKRFGDPIKEGRRVLRVLVSYNATNYFILKGRQAGLEFELMNSFEKDLNKNRTADKKVHLFYIALPFDQLIPALLDGRGDVIAAGMTITPERSNKVLFSKPYRTGISEVTVRNRTAEKLTNSQQLSGKTVAVVKGSSYVTHLNDLNDLFKREKKPLVKIIEADKSLTSEDILQMVNAGIYKYTIVDSHIASLWSQVLDNITVDTGATISTGSEIAWAMRKSDSAFKFKLNTFLQKNKQGTLTGNVLFNRYYKNTRWIKNPVDTETMKRFQDYQKSFIKYGREYKIDWLMLTALGYQESKLNQWVESKQGAVGVMQIKPSTAADKNIKITGVRNSYDRNIHAATKYLAFIRKRYFSDPKIEPLEQLAFTLAAYNAGAARITKMRNRAKLLGKDPNKWFFSVEQVTRQYSSSEPVDYVAHIMKYYVAFKSLIAAEEARKNAAEMIK